MSNYLSGMKKHRSRTAEQKLAILKEGEQEGITATIRKYGIYTNTYYQWKEKYEREGLAGLGSRARVSDPELKRLQRENKRLKQLLAEKDLELSIKDELLKKTPRTSR